MYSIRIMRRAMRDLSNLPQQSADLMSRHIDSLSENPRPRSAKRLQGRTDYSFTVLVFAAAGQMQLNGMAVPGRPYPRDAWSKSLGQARSSCCFALAETMVDAPK